MPNDPMLWCMVVYWLVIVVRERGTEKKREKEGREKEGGERVNDPQNRKK